MTQMLHNTFKAYRPSDSQRLGLAGDTICVSCPKGNEWYEVPGAGGKGLREVDD